MKICLIGARGFLGKSLMGSLPLAGHSVVAVSRHWSDVELRLAGSGCTLVRADASREDELLPALQDCGAAIYLAYEGIPLSAGPDYPDEYRGNLETLNHTLDAAIRARVSRFAFVSSGGTVYGESLGRASIESDVLAPISHYGKIKSLSESLVRDAAERSGQISYTIARVANPFGIEQMKAKRQGLAMTAILSAVRKRPVFALGNGVQVRDYLSVEDCVVALEKCATEGALKNEIVKIGSGIGRSAREVFSCIQRVCGLQLDIRSALARPDDVDRNVLDTTRINTLTGWRPEKAFELAIDEMWSQVRQKCLEGQDPCGPRDGLETLDSTE